MGQQTVREAILEWLHACEQQMFDLLQEVVGIESGSYDKGGADKVGAVFKA